MQNPVFLNLFQIKFPVAAIVSILHRISGVIIFLAMPFMILWFYYITYSDLSFARYLVLSDVVWVKAFYFLILVALSYHVIAGLRHIYHDFSGSHSLVGARISAWLTLIASLLWTAILFYRVFF
ncbi:MAG: succinate dehydrogenase, cytochrome b556 subunit [Legionellales bacterium]|jgi:succinate dehydrogenase / fumarate reductase, cytochrome b subunit|nr:succinate dehydrogenase, cytochrome b556 subunit [Legionellales bacterium]